MKKGWVQVSIVALIDAGELLGALGDSTVSGGWQEDGVVHLYWPESQWKEKNTDDRRSTICSLEGAFPTQDNRHVFP